MPFKAVAPLSTALTVLVIPVALGSPSEPCFPSPTPAFPLLFPRAPNLPIPNFPLDQQSSAFLAPETSFGLMEDNVSTVGEGWGMRPGGAKVGGGGRAQTWDWGGRQEAELRWKCKQPPRVARRKVADPCFRAELTRPHGSLS